MTNSPTYADGRLVLFIEWSGGSYGAVVLLDEQGKVVFTVGVSGRVGHRCIL